MDVQIISYRCLGLVGVRTCGLGLLRPSIAFTTSPTTPPATTPPAKRRPLSNDFSCAFFDLPLEDLPLEDLPFFDLPLEDLPLEDLPFFDLPLEDLPLEELFLDDLVEDLPLEELFLDDLVEDLPLEELFLDDLVEDDEDVREHPRIFWWEQSSLASRALFKYAISSSVPPLSGCNSKAILLYSLFNSQHETSLLFFKRSVISIAFCEGSMAFALNASMSARKDDLSISIKPSADAKVLKTGFSIFKKKSIVYSVYL